jgi:hypothetical protein
MAVLLSCVLLLLWALAGLAVLKVGRHRWKLGTLLLAPSVGLAAFGVPTYILARFGVPVRQTAAPVVLGLLAVAALVLWRARPSAARARGLWRHGRPFAAILAGALLLTAWPMIGYGFDWIANGNDDMANYCVVAAGYRDHAFATMPTIEEAKNTSDGTRSYWFLYVVRQSRAGSEMVLALTSVWTGLSPSQVFMPVIVALNLALVSSVCGLIWLSVGRRAALISGALLAVSGACSYSVVQQLIAQVSGLGLLCASLALVSDRFRRLPRGVLVRRGIACGVAFSGLVVFYSEVVPLLVGACVVMGLRDIAKRQLDRRYLAHAAVAIVVMSALLPVYLYCVANFMREQGTAGGYDKVRVEIFSFYMTPRALALMWGFLPQAGRESGEFQNACIVGGFLLLAGLLLATARNVVRRRPAASVLAVMIILTAVLYIRRDAFGLFKITLFVQPFLWATVGTWAAAQRGRRALAAAAVLLAVVAVLNARLQYWYVGQSRGIEYRVELPVTSQRTLTEFRTSYARHVATGEVDRVLIATDNNVLMKLLAAEVREVPIRQGGIAPFSYLVANGLRDFHKQPILRVHGEWQPLLEEMREQVSALQADRACVRDPDTGVILHQLIAPQIDLGGSPPQRVLVLGGGGSLSVLNRAQFPESGSPVVCTPLADLKNFAVFSDATGARQRFLGMSEGDKVGLQMIEKDGIFRKRTMAGVGRSVVLNVLNPTPRVRVLLSFTSSYLALQTGQAVPQLQVVGDRRVSLGANGLGAARLVSPPLAPQAVASGHYLVVDFGKDIWRRPNQLIACEKLWGTELPRDRRWLAGHAREISILTEEEYAAFAPPEAIQTYPNDLTHPHLEYSGFFEDGFVGCEAKVRLTQPSPDHQLVLRVQVPRLPGGDDFRTELTVLLDGVPAEKRMLGTGEFEVRVPGGKTAQARWVECRFSHTQLLPPPDGRRAAARLTFIGFEPARPAQVSAATTPKER